MPETALHPLGGSNYGNWIRMRTLVNLRWLAIVGQSAAVMISLFQFDLELNVWAVMTVIAASIAANIIFTIAFPENKRLTDRQAMLMLLFDLVQLGALLFLTGGLKNPFAILMLAPVAIAASALGLYSTLVVAIAAVSMVSALAVFFVPLRLGETDLFIPPLFAFGFWVAMVVAIVFMAGYARRVAVEINSMSRALIATQVALGREQKLTDLGGVVAATAHELGTPLATIKLASSELAEALEDSAELVEDARLIRSQADRCSTILRDMGRAGRDDRHMHFAPVSSVMREAADPHEGRGKAIHFSARHKDGALHDQPTIHRYPEIIHGIRNFVQNAVDFAAANVWVDVAWTQASIIVTVADDGRGYPPEMIGRIGDPFLRKRKTPEPSDPERPEYEGMGLGLFIAKTLLERTEAEITFANGTDPFLRSEEVSERCGAIVDIVWPRAAIEAGDADMHGPLGQNPRFTT